MLSKLAARRKYEWNSCAECDRNLDILKFMDYLLDAE